MIKKNSVIMISRYVTNLIKKRLTRILLTAALLTGANAHAQQVQNLRIGQLSSHAAFVDWDNMSDATGYEVAYGADNDMRTATTLTVDGSFVMLSNLSPSTRYWIQVRKTGGEWSERLLFGTGCSGSATLRMGESSSTSYGQYLPLDTYYRYSYAQMLYPLSSMGQQAADIRAISFFVNEAVSTSRDISVRMCLTNQSGISTWIAESDFTTVYEGTVDVANGELHIELDQPFPYDGSSNLVVAVLDNTGSYTSNSQFLTHYCENGSIYYYTDYSGYGPSSPYSDNQSSYVPDMALEFCTNASGCNPRCLAVTEIRQDAVTIVWSDGSEGDGVTLSDYDLYVRDEQSGSIINTAPGMATSFELTGLAGDADYTAYIVNRCGSETSQPTSVAFHTAPAPMSVIYVTPDGNGNGSSWSNALSDLQQAIDMASLQGECYGTVPPQIWMAAGRYYSQRSDEAAFRVPAGVTVVGGFAGNEPETYDLGLRNTEIHLTELNGNDMRTVVTMEGAPGRPAVMDGVRIADGYAQTMAAGVEMGAFTRLTNCSIEGCDNNGSNPYGVLHTSYSNESAALPIVERCVITDNYGETLIYDEGMVMRNCLVANNSASQYLITNQNTSSKYVGNTIANNMSSYGSNGIVIHSYSRCSLTNNIVWGNDVQYPEGDETMVYMEYGEGLVDGNAIEGERYGSNGIALSSTNSGSALSPHFVRPSAGAGTGYPAGDWRLGAESPCVNMGTNADTAIAGILDLDGTPRVKHDSIDMGCYESSYLHQHPQGYGSHIYVSQRPQADTNEETGASWQHSFRDLKDAINTAAYLGNTDIWVAKGIYQNSGRYGIEKQYLTSSNVVVRGGFEGDEPENADPGLRHGDTSRTVLVETAIRADGGAWDGFMIESGTFYDQPVVTLNGASLTSTIVRGTKTYNHPTVKIAGGKMTNCLLTDNEAYSSRLLECDGADTVAYNTMVGNHGRNSISSSDSDIIYNNIIWNNTNDSDFATGDLTSIRHNAIDHPLNDNLLLETAVDGSNSQKNYVRFVDIDFEDYRLKPNSACIDAATSSTLVDNDLNGSPRPYGEGPDMGCYEYGGQPYCDAPAQLAAVEVMGTSVLIGWSNHAFSSDTDSPECQIEAAEAASGVWELKATTTLTQAMIDGLQPETDYLFRVRTACDGGWTAWSAPMALTTRCMVPIDEVKPDAINYSSYNALVPTAPGYKYSHTQMIYPASMLGHQSRPIDTLSFMPYSSYNYSYSSSIVIYLCNVDEDQFATSRFRPTDGMVRVFDGTVDWGRSTRQWIKIPLDTTFMYDGNKNLMIAIDNNTGSARSYFYFYGTNEPVYRSVYYTSSSDFNVTASLSANRSYNLPLLYLPETCLHDGCAPMNITVAEIGDTTATIRWSTPTGTPLMKVAEIDGEYADVEIDVQSQGRNEFTLTGLKMNTTYRVRMANLCGSDTSMWRMIQFTTRVARRERLYVASEASGRADGSSWDNATSDLQFAIGLAHAIDSLYGDHTQVWLKEGVYNTGSTYVLQPNMTVMGGFAGNEAPDYNTGLRDLASHRTIIRKDPSTTYRYLTLMSYANNANNGVTVDGLEFDGENTTETFSGHVALRNIVAENINLTGIATNLQPYTDRNGDRRYPLTAAIEHSRVNRLYAQYAKIYCNLIGRDSQPVTITGPCELVNNTVIGNYGGAAVYGSSAYNSYVVNNIITGSRGSHSIYQSEDNVYMPVMLGSDPIFRHNAVEGGLIQVGYSDTLRAEICLGSANDGYLGPHFADTVDYSLAVGSPCLKQGEAHECLGTLGNNAADLGWQQTTLPYQQAACPYSRHVYVKADGTGDGSSWDNAMGSITEAAFTARHLGGLDIWAAAGTYYGDTLLQCGHYVRQTDLYGGFEGNEPADYDLSRRDIKGHPTILDGDGRRRVLRAEGGRIDGITIRNGYYYAIGQGAGVHCDSTSFANCTFENNRLNGSASSTLRGGAIYATAHITVTNSTFVGNGLYSRPGSTSGFEFDGGAIHAPSALVMNTIFRQNTDLGLGSSYSKGMAVYATGLDNQETYVVNCDMIENNCSTLLYAYGDPATMHLHNSILWANYFYDYNYSIRSRMTGSSLVMSGIDVRYCAVEDGLQGEGNIILSTPNYEPSSATTSIALRDSAAGDYRLLPTSTCVDAGSSSLYVGHAAATATDIDGSDRIWSRSIDMGCHEYDGADQCEAPSGLDAQVVGLAVKLTWQNNVYSAADTATLRRRHSQVAYRTQDSPQWHYEETDHPQCIISGLNEETLYVMKVRTMCADGYTQWSDSITAYVECAFKTPDLEIARTSTTGQLPANINYKFSYTQTLLTADEMNGQDTISRIDIRYTGANTVNRNWAIYLGNVWTDAFSASNAWVGTTAMTQVYNGNVRLDTTGNDGWIEIEFDTFFVHEDGAGMVIAIDDNTGTKSGTTYFPAEYNSSKYRSLYINSDYTNYNPAAITSSGSRSYYRPQIRIEGRCTDGCIQPVVSIVSVTDSDAVVQWGNADNVEMQLRRRDQSEWSDIAVRGNEVNLGRLRGNTEYEVRMRNLCSTNTSSAWVTVGFETHVPRLERIYVKETPDRLADGSDWLNATDDLRWAVSTAYKIHRYYNLNTDVWVAQGVYHGDTTLSQAFEIVEGVNVTGGFVGYERDSYDLKYRDLEAHQSVLDAQGQQPVLLQKTAFSQNTATTWDGFVITRGANGNALRLNSYGQVKNCVISNNTNLGPVVESFATAATQSTPSTNYTALITNCRIENNTSTSEQVVACDHTAIVNTLIANNSNHYYGTVHAGTSILVNCDIVNNLLDSEFGSAGISYGTAYNCIVWGNRQGSSISNLGSNANTYYCAVESGGTTNGNIVLPSTNSGTGNNYVRFQNPTPGAGSSYSRGDWHLAVGSICADRGNNSYANISRWNLWDSDNTLDLDRLSRQQGEQVDLGCYESGNTRVVLPDYPDHIIYVNAASDSYPADGTSWATAYNNLNQALEIASLLDHVDIWVAEGTYRNPQGAGSAFKAVPMVNVYGGLSGNEPSDYDMSRRDLESHQTVLEAGSGQRVLHIDGNSIWDGFVITRGSVPQNDRGGGAFVRNGTLRNCEIRNNHAYSYGGGVYAVRARIQNCHIHHNDAGHGGGVYVADDSWISQCRITDNSAIEGGGAYTQGVVMANSILSDNAGTTGYAVYDMGCNTFANCTFVKNYGTQRNYTNAYALYNPSQRGTQYRNCVAWGNRNANGTVSSFGDNTSSYISIHPDLQHCAFDGTYHNDGDCIHLDSVNYYANGTSAYARFQDPEHDDFRLMEGSALIDAGISLADMVITSTLGTLANVTTDLDGALRHIGTAIDLGCYEYSQESYCQPPRPNVTQRDGYAAMITWQPSGNGRPAGYEVQYAPADSSNWTTLPATANTYTIIENLLPETRYKVRVRTLCGNNDTSVYSQPQVFSTDCPMRSHPIVIQNSQTEDTYGDQIPFNPTRNGIYAFTVTRTDLDSIPREIDSIAFKYIHEEPLTRDLEIYISETSAPELTHLPMSANRVFHGRVTFDQTNSWVSIPLDRKLHYSGNAHLVVRVVDRTNGYNACVLPARRFATLPNRMSVWGDSTYMATYATMGHGDTFNRCVEIRFPGACDSMDCLTGFVAAQNVTDSSALIVWGGGQSSMPVQVQLRDENVRDFIDLDSSHIGPYTCVRNGNEMQVSGLSEYTTYIARIRSVCGEEHYGEWEDVVFRTEVDRHERIFVKPHSCGKGDGSSWDNAIDNINQAQRVAYGVNRKYHIQPQVWVAEGTYFGDTLSSSAAFTMMPTAQVFGGFCGNEPDTFDLSNRDLDSHQTILDGRNQRRVLISERCTETTQSVFDGFHIVHGFARPTTEEPSSVTEACGGGAYLTDYAFLQNCQISHNYAEDYGGGVYLQGSEAHTAGIANSKVTNNNTNGSGGGVAGSMFSVTNCLVANNTSNLSGAGIYARQNTSIVAASTIVRNLSIQGSGDVDVFSGPGLQLQNNYIYVVGSIIWGNQSGNRIKANRHGILFHHTGIENGAAYGGSPLYLSPDNNGEFFSPSFIQPTTGAGANYTGGDWHLNSSSYCANRYPSGWQYMKDYYMIRLAPQTDLDGNERTRQDTIDLGCYESGHRSTGNPHYTGRIFVSTTGAGNRTGNNWQNAVGSIGMAQTLASTYGISDLWVKEGVYYGSFTMHKGLNVYGGFQGNEPSDFVAERRDLQHHHSVLDGRNQTQVLSSPEDGTALWDGFVIRNGQYDTIGEYTKDTNASTCGGVFIKGRTTLKNAIIENCSSYYGGGVVLTDGAKLVNSIVRHNTAEKDGGGVYALQSSIENCLITDNHALNTGGGVYSCASRLTGCAIANNVQSDEETLGGGISNPLYTKTITYWDAQAQQAVSRTIAGTSYMYNSIIWNNRNGQSYGSDIQGYVTLTNCAVENGHDGTNITPIAHDNDGYDFGMFYPRFADPENGDYSLTELSDLIDMGDQTFAYESTEILMNPRVYGSNVDLGPYEVQTNTSACPGVVMMQIDSVTANSATISWHSRGSESRWSVLYGIAGDDNDMVTTVTDTLVTLTDLHHFRNYHVKVRSICEDTLSSGYSVALNFMTLCDSIQTLPPTGTITYFYPPYDEVVDSVVDFSWTSLADVTSYDLFLWSGDSSACPETPFASGITQPRLSGVALPHFAHDKDYYWKVRAWNECRSSVSATTMMTTNGNRWLHVTELDNSYPMSGQTMTVRYSVANDGSGRTRPGMRWRDKIWISKSCQVSPTTGSPDEILAVRSSQILLKEIENIRALNPGEFYSNSVEVRIPDTVTGDWFLIVITDTMETIIPDFSFYNRNTPPIPYTPSKNGFPYPYIGSSIRKVVNDDGSFYYIDIDSNETRMPIYWEDQFSYKPVTIAQSPLPDLQVTDFQHPTNIFSNREIEVSWTVKNLGQADTRSAWGDKVALVRVEDAETMGLADTQNGFHGNAMNIPMLPVVCQTDVPHTGTLNADSSYTVNARLFIPIEVFGDFYLYVHTDYGNRVYESLNFHNNTYASPYPMHITLQPTPDLVTRNISVPDSVVMLDTFDVEFTIRNDGLGNMDDHMVPFRNTLYISRSDTFDANARRLGIVECTSAIDIGGETRLTMRCAIPDNSSGTYYIYAQADSFNEVLEYGSEDNNVTRSHAIVIRYPDLEVRNIVVTTPDSVSAGALISIDYDVANVGTGKTHRNTWRDGIYMARSSVFSFAAAERVKVVRHTDGLGRDSVYHVSANVSVPGHISGNWYVHIYTDFDSSLYERGHEANNHLMSQQLITVLQPDLVVSAAELPSEADGNTAFTTAYTITNRGRGSISNQTVSNIFSYYGDAVFRDTVSGLTMNPGESIVRYAQFELPCTPYDSAAIEIRLDADDAVAESVENNNTYTSPLRIRHPDLTIGSVQVPDTAASGSDILVRYSVVNHGDASTHSTNLADSLFLSRSSEVPDTFGYRWQHTYQAEIGAGDTLWAGLHLGIPEDAEGTYYLHVLTNTHTDDQVCEGPDRRGNAIHSQAVTIMPSPCADLSASTASMGNHHHTNDTATLTYILYNHGQSNVDDVVINRIYLSPSPNEYFEDGLIGIDTVSVTLAPQDSTPSSCLVKVPRNLPDGPYHIYVVVDADNRVFEREGESDNTCRCGTVNITANPVDLTAVSVTGSSRLRWGSADSCIFEFRNASTKPSYGFTNRLYLSADTLLDVGDHLLSYAPHTNGIDGAAGAADRFVFTTPLGYDSASYLIAVADYAMTTGDLYYGNNTIWVPVSVEPIPVPNLVVSDITLLTDTIVCGQPARLSYTVTNVGEADILRGTWKDMLTLSTDSTTDASVAMLAAKTMSNKDLSVGESYSIVTEFTVPVPNTGSFYLAVRTNATRTFFEPTYADNNAAVLADVGIITPGDLVVRHIDFPEEVVLGETIHVAWDVTNMGEAAMTGQNLGSLVYVSYDTLFGPDDRLVATPAPVSIDLSATEYLTQIADIRLAGIPQGDYYLIVVTDVLNAFYETNERNNITYSSCPIHVSVRELPFNTPVSDTFRTSQPNDYRLTVGDQRNQTVRVHLTTEDTVARAGNMIFVSYNTIGDNLNYTYSSAGRVTGNPEVYIPSTLAGYYGVSVYASATYDSVQRAQIEADILPFQLSSIEPAEGGNNGRVTIALTGSRFRPGMQVWLRRGSDTIRADEFQFADYYRGYASFDLKDADTGRYSLGINNLCDGYDELSQCFSIREGEGQNLVYDIVSPGFMRQGTTAAFTLEYGNFGTTDITNKVLDIRSYNNYIGTSSEHLYQENRHLRIPLKVPDQRRCVLPPGASQQVRILVRVLDAADFQMSVDDAKEEDLRNITNQ